jgi:FPC/CPF motif-containing protein YcgG
MIQDLQHIRDAYHAFIGNKTFPCVGAKTAFAKSQARSMVAGNMACPAHDEEILRFLYEFIDNYRSSDSTFHSAAILFDGPNGITEDLFEKLLWQRLQSLLDLDAKLFSYDNRVSNDPGSSEFSLSIKQEAFFIIGMHPASSRPSRRFEYPALVFNPHAQFTAMKETGKYDRLKDVVRKRDLIYSGSINPMLNDHGRSSEVQQYSGRKYDTPLVCPLKISHATT